MRFRFGRYELDEDAGELRHDGRPVAIQPKPLALLVHLVRERERVVPFDELYELLWSGVAVTPSSLTRAVSVARSAIGDTGRGDVIKSVARRGYRFSADVVCVESGPRTAAQRGASADAARDPFVGRDAALATLRSAWADAAAGRGRLALVTGPPGMGKTRLGEEMARELEASGARLLVGRARDGEGVPALWLWAQILRQIAALPPGAHGEPLAIAASALAELAPELATGLPHVERGGATRSPDQNRFLLFEAITGALLRLAGERPVLLFLEDLQWAGSSSLRLLEHLAFETADAPLLVLATVRSEPRLREHPVERLLAVLRAQRHVVEVTLRGFSRREVAQLLEHALGRPAPADLSSELVARTEGIPLLLREALRLLAERGDLREPESVRRWAVSLPSHALDLVQRPLERLSPPCAELLAAGAVLGREWTLPLAAAVAGIGRDVALDLADEAAAAGVIEPAPESAASWRFSHALFQEGVYARLPAGARVRLHARAADEIERRHAGDVEHVIAELAHHRHASLAVGDPERAFACAEQAASQALRVFAFEQAATHYGQALAAIEHAEPIDASRRLATLLSLGEALGLAGDREQRRRVFDRALAEARAQERPLDLARAAIGFCDVAEWAPEDEEGLARLDEALAALPADAERERAQLLTRIAYLSPRRHFERAVEIARIAVEQARRLADPEIEQDALYALHFLLAGPDFIAECESLAQESIAAARRGSVCDVTVITALDDASNRLMMGDAAGARESRALAADLAGRTPTLARRFNMMVYDSGVATLEGRLDEAARIAEEAFAIGARIQHPYLRGIRRLNTAVLARNRGDEEAVLRIFDPRPPIRGGPLHWVRSFTARALVAVGRVEEARAVFEELARQGFDSVPRNIRWPCSIVEIAHLCADLRDADRAAALIPLLEPTLGRHGLIPVSMCYAGPVSLALARLADVCGDTDRADALFDDAVQACEALGARPMQAQSLLEHGALLLRLGRRADARARFEAGRRIAAALGLGHLAARAAAPSARTDQR